MANPKMVKSWLLKAIKDFKTARFIFDGGDDELLEACAFHCQQSIEKSLKAYLVFKNIRVSKTHNLEELSRQILKKDNSISLIKENLPLMEKYTDYNELFTCMQNKYPNNSVSLRRFYDSYRFFSYIIARLNSVNIVSVDREISHWFIRQERRQEPGPTVNDMEGTYIH